MSDNVVIVGGGFAGFWAAAAARRTGGPDLPVTLISPTPHLVMRPRLYEAHPETLAVDLVALLGEIGVRYIGDTAVDVDVPNRTLDLAGGEAVQYGRLVVATGSVMVRPPVPGAEEAYSIDTRQDAVVFDRHLAALAERHRVSGEPVVAVVGAGFTGIELALELRDRFAAHGDHALGERARIVLIDRTGEVGHDLGPNPRPAIEDALRAARVELRLGVAVTSLGAEDVGFAGGDRLRADAVVLSTGLRAAPFAALLAGERDELGRILVDSRLRALQCPGVFVTGDSAAADTGDGHRALTSCQHALQLGRVAGENAARDLAGRPLVAYEQLRYVTCLDLGRAGAVLTQGWERNVVESGERAKTRKQFINRDLIYPATTAVEILRQSNLDPAARG